MIQEINLLKYKFTSIEIDYNQMEIELSKIQKERYQLKQEIQMHIKACEQLKGENAWLDRENFVLRQGINEREKSFTESVLLLKSSQT